MSLIKYKEENHENHWKWRYQISEKIAKLLKKEFSGIKSVYIIGSVKNALSGPCSDIDLLVHFDGTQQQKNELEIWIKGWSQCLAVINEMLTGYECASGLIDLHVITDEDIAAGDSFAVKINAHTDGARKIG